MLAVLIACAFSAFRPLVPLHSVALASAARIGGHIIAAAAGEYDDDITLTVDGQSVDAASSLLIMTLGAEKGHEVTISSENADAVEAIATMIENDLDH